MPDIGYKLSSEEHGPRTLVRNAARAEQAGFAFALISDHYHPWTDKQGESPFVWSVIGGIAEATDNLQLGTGVTCPTMRIHPAIIAHAAATVADMMEGRFFLGVGTGENLNEHITGDAWPAADIRLEMLQEAVEVMRALWEGKLTRHYGEHYTVENARIYSLPDEPPDIYVAAAGTKAATIAGMIGDGLIGVAPNEESVKTFEDSGGKGKPKIAEMHVCYGPDEDKALQTAVEWWPNIAMSGQLGQDLALPSHYEAIAELVRPDDVADKVAVGPDPERHLKEINKFLDAGYDQVTVHQIGPDQDGFFGFYEQQILPKLA